MPQDGLSDSTTYVAQNIMKGVIVVDSTKVYMYFIINNQKGVFIILKYAFFACCMQKL